MRHLLIVLLLAAAVAGCCDHPQAFKRAQDSMLIIQGVYDPLVGAYLADQTNGYLKAGLVAADTALALAGQIQAAKCATPQEADQLALQAQQVAAAAGAQ
jgi:hypothetical protein